MLLTSTTVLAAEDAVLARMMALNTEDALFVRLEALSGPNAIACGAVKLGENDAAAIECARKALAEGRPFWVAAQLQSTESISWRGVALEPGKTGWLVTYERRKSWEASLDEHICHKPQFAPGQMRCVP
jgi:hypothetical protein